ncbi:multidrug resistance-associated protein 4 [Agrilus planipennis]|uniref:Multidrug resistance-associated protein 4 n=1 Tax=Agrilus planipennis TaxID=224129 RepID=A0A1W4WE54_AGRPL|nr:multidrug resistance-associated protein 4 [Agrilus planipennis]
MDNCIKLNKQNPKKEANCISKLFFVWLVKIIYKATKQPLSVDDLYQSMDSDGSCKLTDTLEKHWEDELWKAKTKNSKPSLLCAITKTFLAQFSLAGLALFIAFAILKPLHPVILATFIQLFYVVNEEVDEENRKHKIIYGSLMIAISIVFIFLMHHANLAAGRVGMRVRIACCSLVYRKLLKLSKKSLNDTAAGQVVNLLSNDVNRFDLVVIFLHFVWIMPLQAVILSYLIWMEVGPSALAGVLAMILLTIPVQGYLGKLASTLRLKVAKKTDSRVKIMSELISGIQVIKMYAWEKPFADVVKMSRSNEIKTITMANFLKGVNLSSAVFLERLVLYLTILTYVLLGSKITADKVFSIAQLFNTMQLTMAIFYPNAVTLGSECLVSVKRLQDFLLLEEKPTPKIVKKTHKSVILDNITAFWSPSVATLKDLTFRVNSGELCAIVGPVGSGKSSILQLLLGELLPSEGNLEVGGSISYASQEPWLFVSTVQKNILFGQKYKENYYKQVVKVCALETDFKQFPYGDKTLVGERGVSLSGGQKARINLARAVYREADIYLLDDPLSAVDTHVGKHLFEECIIKYLRGKTRILVTHQLQYLKKADKIIVLNDGRIEAYGSFEELSKHTHLSFTNLLISSSESSETVKKTAEVKRTESIISTKSVKSESSVQQEDEEENEEKVNKLGAKAYVDYARSGGNFFILAGVIIMLVAAQLASSAADYWTSYWTSQEERRFILMLNCTAEHHPEILLPEFGENSTNYLYNVSNSNSTYYQDCREDDFDLISTNSALLVYTLLILGSIVITTSRSMFFLKVCMRASKKLHGLMFNSLLVAPMRFFDTNPSGRILNRFSRDMGIIDELLPRIMLETLQILFVMIGILINVSIANDWMIIVAVILGAVFIKVQSWYVASARDIKHLEGTTRSPVFSHLNASLNGITTIRASAAEMPLRKEFDSHQDTHTSAWYLTIACISAFGLWLDILSVLYIACVAFSFVFMNASGSYVGLAVSQSLTLTGMLQFGMRQMAEVISYMTCVERVLEYTTLDKEGPFETAKENKPQKMWPSKGQIIFQHVFLQYSPDDPPVLKDLSFYVKGGEKVGIVGRTGAGKSSLISALFRLTNIDGTIFIDGVDTKLMGLNELRRSISIIPQEPVLFSASMRYNLDPFDEYEDKAVWHALEEVELKESVASLDLLVQEGGSNFSVGQRQLICLARAILRNNKVLVLDEATANVDPRTDALIQATIRRKFKTCTVLTIAHRLNTIMDSDKVLVMDGGRIAEYDHPHKLLQNAQGHFYKMVAETGPSMAVQLHDAAYRAYKNSYYNDDDVTKM